MCIYRLVTPDPNNYNDNDDHDVDKNDDEASQSTSYIIVNLNDTFLSYSQFKNKKDETMF
jgi:hypothetical protein